MSEDQERFERDVTVDDPGIVGARWWNQSLQRRAAEGDVSRRSALGAMSAVGAVVAVGAVGIGGACLVGVAGGFDDDTETRAEPSLAAQRRYGWDLGARHEPLPFAVISRNEPFDTAALARDLTPVTWRHVYQSALLDAPDATPQQNLGEETVSARPLRGVMVAGVPVGVERFIAVGMGLARLFADRSARTALVVDLAGPESVALAAGAASVFEPVLAIGNWPHPRGVIHSQDTLATALQCHRYFHDARATRPAGAPPCFVLERNRLTGAVTSEQFDNRFLAQLPSAATLRAGGIERVLYVVPFASDLPELDDINEDLVAWAAAGLDVRAMGAGSFMPGPDGAYYYGGNPAMEAGFFHVYPWGTPGAGAVVPVVDPRAAAYRPARRVTTLSRSTAGPSFGTVALVVSGAAVLGAAFDRRGSWHRASSWGGG
ncbi:MAG: hypothetical protein U0325_13195 [Polyangiales bacterium]